MLLGREHEPRRDLCDAVLYDGDRTLVGVGPER